MQIIADFHLHSKYSRATSQEMNLENLERGAKIKGIQIIGTGDFTHPEYFSQIKEKLRPLGNGLFSLKEKRERDSSLFFILSAEISCIYSKNNRTRKIHLIVLSPSIEIAEKINTQLSWIGNLQADGRPILGLDAKELLKIVLNVSNDCLIIPAHIWTPHFSLFGSQSGFDSIEECFEELTSQIYALETGLSSDLLMNFRLSALDQFTLVSNSDAHSLRNLGREANVFDLKEISYQEIIKAIKNRDNKKFKYTIEFFPEEGKYHFDGHRNCQIRFSPKETKEHSGLCPVCKKFLTIGVMHRVEKLADRKKPIPPKGAPSFKYLVPLEEIIAQALNQQRLTKAVQEEYSKLIQIFGNEFKILLDASFEDLSREVVDEKIALGIKNMREGKIKVFPGYDGVFGEIRVIEEEKELKQTSLF